jgi:hypothetical protein
VKPMTLLFEVIVINGLLALTCLAFAWRAIARKGFAGVLHDDSFLAKILMGSGVTDWRRSKDGLRSSSAVVELFLEGEVVRLEVPTALVVETLTMGERVVPAASYSEESQIWSLESPIRATTSAPTVQEIKELCLHT